MATALAQVRHEAWPELVAPRAGVAAALAGRGSSAPGRDGCAQRDQLQPTAGGGWPAAAAVPAVTLLNCRAQPVPPVAGGVRQGAERVRGRRRRGGRCRHPRRDGRAPVLRLDDGRRHVDAARARARERCARRVYMYGRSTRRLITMRTRGGHATHAWRRRGEGTGARLQGRSAAPRKQRQPAKGASVCRQSPDVFRSVPMHVRRGPSKCPKRFVGVKHGHVVARP